MPAINLLGAVLLNISPLCSAYAAEPRPVRADEPGQHTARQELAPGPGPLESLAGGWYEVEARWLGGPTLWGFERFEPVAEGRHLMSRTLVRDDDGPLYERYVTLYTPAEHGEISATGFTAAGEVQTSPMATRGGVLLSTSTMEGAAGPLRVRQEVEPLVGGDAFAWRVWVGPEGGAEPPKVMDALWHRMDPARTLADGTPNPERTATSHPREESARRIVVKRTLPLPPERVFELRTDADEFVRWFAPGAKLGDERGEPYEVYILPEGSPQRDSEGCTVLAAVPARLLSFTWNAPPSFSEQRDLHTRVTLRMTPAPGGGCELSLSHRGFPKAADEPDSDWARVAAYFERAWPGVMNALQARCRALAEGE